MLSEQLKSQIKAIHQQISVEKQRLQPKTDKLQREQATLNRQTADLAENNKNIKTFLLLSYVYVLHYSHTESFYPTQICLTKYCKNMTILNLYNLRIY